MAEAARAHGLALHLDGARLWNAAVALGETPAALAAPVDTVNVCLSKGLGAPVGSVLAGPADLLREARRVRKLLGGGMRQVGVLAAAALVALDDFEADDHALVRADHARARRLAEAVEAAGLALVRPPDTNIVLFATPEPAAEAVAGLEEAGVRTVAFGPHAVRAILHRDVDDAAVEAADDAIRRRYA